MFHGYDYPNETGKNELVRRLWRARMSDGIVDFPAPTDISEAMRQFIRNMEPTPFENKRNFTLLDADASVRELINNEET